MKQSTSKKAAAPVAAGAAGNVARLFNEELPPEETPAADNKQLEVAMLWGDTIINVRHFSEGEQVTVGASKANHFHVFSSAVGETFPLVSTTQADATVLVP
ncbi:MAG: hypothetical protein ACK4N5_21315, partial [Myxococcales bacterium]